MKMKLTELLEERILELKTTICEHSKETLKGIIYSTLYLNQKLLEIENDFIDKLPTLNSHGACGLSQWDLYYRIYRTQAMSIRGEISIGEGRVGENVS